MYKGLKLNYDKLTKGWFSMRRITSYNRPFMCITGKRSTGKSTGVAIWLICEFYRTEQGWVYTRRTKDTSELTCSDWFDNACAIINAEYNIGLRITCKGGYYRLSDKSDITDINDDTGEETREETICGRVVPLSLQQKVKGSNLSMFDWLVYDEFVAFRGERYLGKSNDPIYEYDAIHSLAETIDRGVGVAHRNAVKVICLGNNESFYNPMYIATGADRFIRTDTKILSPKNVDWIVQQLTPEDAINAEDYKDTSLYRLASARTRAYAYENEAKEADGAFIENHDKDTLTAVFEGVFDGFHFIVYSYNDGLYVSPGTRPGLKCFALTNADHTPDYHLPFSFDGYEILQLKVMYTKGKVRFKDRKSKYCIDNYFKFCK